MLLNNTSFAVGFVDIFEGKTKFSAGNDYPIENI